MKFVVFPSLFFLAIFTLGFSSCIDDDGIPATPVTLCTDTDYLAFRSDGQVPSAQIDVVSNTTPFFNTTTFAANTSFTSPVSTLGNNSSAWDPVGQRMVFIDQWNNSGLWVYDQVGNNVTQVSIPTTNQLTAPEFLNGQLYVVEVDFGTQSLILRGLTITGTSSTLGAPLHTVPFSSMGLSSDTMNNLLFSTSDKNDQLYIMGRDKVLIFDVSLLTDQLVSLPTSNGSYHDLVWTQDGTLLSVFNDSGSADIVRLDVSTPTATQTTEIPGISVNPESISLVYKECGDRLHLLTHFTFGGSGVETRIYDIEMLSKTTITRDMPGWVFGMAHRY